MERDSERDREPKTVGEVIDRIMKKSIHEFVSNIKIEPVEVKIRFPMGAIILFLVIAPFVYTVKFFRWIFKVIRIKKPSRSGKNQDNNFIK